MELFFTYAMFGLFGLTALSMLATMVAIWVDVERWVHNLFFATMIVTIMGFSCLLILTGIKAIEQVKNEQPAEMSE